MPVTRRLLSLTILAICLALIVRIFLVDTYQVPTGSMAPALLGHHRACTCPRCGYPVQVGLHARDDGADETKERWYQRAWCPNCGATGLPLHLAPVASGQRLVVNKAAFAMRSPRRWEIVIFHLFGFDLIKRILGLPGEEVEIRDGDLYVGGQLCRKTLAEFKAMRVLVFDNNYQPRPATWACRWEQAPYRPGRAPQGGTALALDAAQAADAWHLVAYRHFCLDTKKCLPIMDEYGYNGAEPCRLTAVHDVMLECDVEIQEGQGTLALGISDGKDHLLAVVPVAQGPGERVTLHAVPSFSLPALEQPGPTLAEASGVSLRPGKRYHVEWAFVDRRVTLTLDGVEALAPLDLPACAERPPLMRPLMVAARGVKASVTNVRLFRDVHYTQAGKNGVTGEVVRLGADQYFVLGDNSPRSEDSRFWPDGGAVPASSLVGAPLLRLDPARPFSASQP
jgi:signal peptidase I